MRNSLRILVATTVLTAVTGLAGAHCQIPCGIYDDELRVQLMEEHVTTIEKSMRQIVELGSAEAHNPNQLVRWVVNKEQHAQELQDIVTAYFMAQRIKVPDAMEGDAWTEYVTRLTLLHRIQVEAMKAKQTTDLAHVEALRGLIAKFRTAYFGEEGGHTH
jgi:nickel superoxide dismutase